MNRTEKEAVLHCLKSMIDEEACEECPLYGTTGTDHCEKDCVRLAINALEQEPKTGHWISSTIQGEIDGQIVKAFICSECGAISVFRITGGKIVNGDLCSNCGAKME